MTNTWPLLIAVFALGAGTYSIRLAGPLLRDRVTVSQRFEKFSAAAAIVMLMAVACSATVLDGAEFAGFARPAGVLVGGLLAIRKAPFVLVVVAAAATTALLRVVGIE
jgi:branched-subunit amino acid transport protein